MQVQDLIAQLRVQLNDTQKIEYTDDELITYINEAQNFLAQFLAQFRSRLNQKETEITLTDGIADLPSDFLIEESVKDTDGYPVPYEILGGKLRVAGNYDKVKLRYYHFFPAVATTTDAVQVPSVLIPTLKTFVVFLAKKRIEDASRWDAELFKIFQQYALPVIGLYGKTSSIEPPPVIV